MGQAIDTRRVGVCKKHHGGRGCRHSLVGNHNGECNSIHQRLMDMKISGHNNELGLAPEIISPTLARTTFEYEYIRTDDDYSCGGPVSVGEVPISEDLGALLKFARRKGYTVDPGDVPPRFRATA